VVDADVDGLGADVAKWHLTIVLHEADRFWRAQVRRFGQSLSEFALEIATPRVREAFELLAAGGAPSQAAYQIAHDRKLPSARQSLVDYFNATGAAALVAPASPIAGPAVGPRARTEDDALFDLLTRNMLPATMAAQPSICIPIGANEPVGLLLDGRPGEDRELLALALAAEPSLRNR
jgi:mandelamide amidase